MTNPPVSPDIFAPHCGYHEHLVFFGKLRGAAEAVCICLEPGLAYGFRFGAPGGPPKASFSVAGPHVRGGDDCERIDGVDWTHLSVSQDGVTYTVWVSLPEKAGETPMGRLEIAGEDTGSAPTSFEFEPASILSDLPFD